MDGASVTDWITAGAAVASTLVAVAIWRVTSAYKKSTDRIADANVEMADANRALLAEMREDRVLARRRGSEDAAHRLQVALARAHRGWQRIDASEHPEAWTDILNDWVEATAVEKDALLSSALSQDVNRFTALFRTAATDWETVLQIIETEQGERAGEMRRSRDNRKYRMDWAAERLRRALGAHQRGEDLEGQYLPKETFEFFVRPPGEWDARYDGPLDEIFPGEPADA